MGRPTGGWFSVRITQRFSGAVDHGGSLSCSTTIVYTSGGGGSIRSAGLSRFRLRLLWHGKLPFRRKAVLAEWLPEPDCATVWHYGASSTQVHTAILYFVERQWFVYVFFVYLCFACPLKSSHAAPCVCNLKHKKLQIGIRFFGHGTVVISCFCTVV